MPFLYEWRIVAGLVLIALSAFFSGSESAFFSVLGRGALARIEQERPRAGRLIRQMLLSPQRLISSILVGNTFVNILFSIVIASVFAAVLIGSGRHKFQGAESVWISAVTTLTSAGLILVFGELIPKTIGVRFYRRCAVLAAEPLYWFNKTIFPVEFILRRISRGVLKIIGIKLGAGRKLANQELEQLVEAGGEEGVLEEREYELIRNVFAFGDLTAAEVMTPRHEIFSLPLEMEYSELKNKFLASGFSRVPIYQKSPEQIIGVLTAKDILKLDAIPGPPKPVEAMLRRPFSVPPQKKLDGLLKDFLTRNIHIALVVNEYGEMMGVITLEDLLEEIFGESELEQPGEQEIVDKGENRWEVLGRMDIRDFNQKMDASLSAPGIRTVAGYLLNEFGHFPQLNEELKREGYRFRIKEIKRGRIHKLEVDKTND